MINGAHVIVCSRDAEAARAFFKDVLAFQSVDAGHGWLIFALPPAEAAFHPAEPNYETNPKHELFLMCDDVQAEIARLAEKGGEMLGSFGAAVGFGHENHAAWWRVAGVVSA
jgi:predicted enzyme related to lactoylglutathione lyase